MFVGSVFLLPGQELRKFAVKRPVSRETDNGRTVKSGEEVLLGGIEAILAAAKPEEMERWRQMQHPVSHKIIMRGEPGFPILPGDVFEGLGRRFVNQAMPYNPGDLGHWTNFFCDERLDV